MGRTSNYLKLWNLSVVVNTCQKKSRLQSILRFKFNFEPIKPSLNLPKWKGFNLLDFFSADPNRPYGGTTEEDFKWMSDWGFDFVRIPMAYPSYLDFNRNKDVTPKEVYRIDERAVERVDKDVIDILSTNGIGFAL